MKYRLGVRRGYYLKEELGIYEALGFTFSTQPDYSGMYRILTIDTTINLKSLKNFIDLAGQFKDYPVYFANDSHILIDNVDKD